MHTETVVLLPRARQLVALRKDGQHQLLAVCAYNDQILLGWARVVLLHTKGEVDELVVGLSLVAEEFWGCLEVDGEIVELGDCSRVVQLKNLFKN